MRCFFLFFDQGINFFLGQIGKDLDIFGSIGIAHVQPELVEFIRRCITAIQPNVARLSLAELASVGFRNQRAGQSKSLTTQLTADQLRTGRDVTPLGRFLPFASGSLRVHTDTYNRIPEATGKRIP